jgi:hypothetical protein
MREQWPDQLQPKLPERIKRCRFSLTIRGQELVVDVTKKWSPISCGRLHTHYRPPGKRHRAFCGDPLFGADQVTFVRQKTTKATGGKSSGNRSIHPNEKCCRNVSRAKRHVGGGNEKIRTERSQRKKKRRGTFPAAKQRLEEKEQALHTRLSNS